MKEIIKELKMKPDKYYKIPIRFWEHGEMKEDFIEFDTPFRKNTKFFNMDKKLAIDNYKNKKESKTSYFWLDYVKDPVRITNKKEIIKYNRNKYERTCIEIEKNKRRVKK